MLLQPQQSVVLLECFELLPTTHSRKKNIFIGNSLMLKNTSVQFILEPPLVFVAKYFAAIA